MRTRKRSYPFQERSRTRRTSYPFQERSSSSSAQQGNMNQENQQMQQPSRSMNQVKKHQGNMNQTKNPLMQPSSSSSHKRSRSSISYVPSRSSSLTRDMEIKIQESMYDMVDAKLLTIADLPFAQSWFSDSTWAGSYFLDHGDMMERCSIVKDARNSEDDNKIKRKLQEGFLKTKR